MASFPVFQFDNSKFPMLTPQQTSPLGGVLSDAITKRLAMAQAKKAEKEVPYAGLSAFGNALSHLAYAGNVQPQWAAKLAAHPEIFNNLTEDQQTQLINMANSGTAGGGALAPAIQQAMEIFKKQQEEENQPSFFNNLLGHLSGSQQQNAIPSVQQSQEQSSTPPTAPSSGRLPVVSPNLGEQPRALQNVANAASAKAGAVSSGTALGNQSAEQLKNAQSDSQNAQNMDQLIDSAVSKYQKSFLKGPGLGKLAKYGPDAAQALKDTNTMAVGLASQLYGSNTTNAKEATATTLKLSMEDPEKAFNQFAEKMKAQNDRLKWKGTFYQTMNDPSINITNPQERDQLWFDYNAKYPPYDYKNHKPIYDNLGLDQSKMVKFITQERANTKSLNKRIESTLKQQNKSDEEQFVNNKSGANLLSKGLKIPEFDSQEEANAWFKRQPKITQKAIRAHLGRR